MAKEFNKSAGRNRFYGITVIRPWNDMGQIGIPGPGKGMVEFMTRNNTSILYSIILIEIKMQRLFFKYLEASPLLRTASVQQVQWMLLAHIFPLKRLVVCKVV